MFSFDNEKNTVLTDGDSTWVPNVMAVEGLISNFLINF
jgi:hypothetical protein